MSDLIGRALALETDSLPAMPAAAARVLALLRSPDSRVEDIERVLRLDPGLTANLLRLANSAYFGCAGRIGSVRQAIVRLGWARVSQIVVVLAVRTILIGRVVGYDLPPGELWRHSVAVSVASDDLATQLGVAVPDEIFTAALLHDVGKIAIGHFVRDQRDRIEARLGEGLSFEDIEREILGIDHAEAGALVLANWSLPESLVSAVRWHHDPDSAPLEDPIADIVHVADVLCLMLGVGTGWEGLGYHPSPGATARLGVRVDDLEAVASRMLEGVHALTETLVA